MATVDEPMPGTLAELVGRLGDVPLDRIRSKPPPGTATEKDVIAALEAPRKRLCELVDGVLVEKVTSFQKALLGSIFVHVLWTFVEREDAGILLGPDGTLRILPGQVRMPDISFISWDRLPGGTLPKVEIAAIAPDLAIELLSEGNTRREMERKLRDYFCAGVRLTWLIHRQNQTAKVYTSPTDCRRIGKRGTLDGGTVLPGFRLALKDLFARFSYYCKAPCTQDN